MRFEEVWSARKEDFNSPSIERSALVKTPQDTFRLYVSYVGGRDKRWRIDVLEAERVEDLDPSSRRPILRPGDIDSEGVKTPGNDRWWAVLHVRKLRASIQHHSRLRLGRPAWNRKCIRNWEDTPSYRSSVEC